MKKGIATLLSLIFLMVSAIATPEEDFVRKMKAAFASGSAESFMVLHYLEGTPEELKPMLINRWKQALTKELISVEILPFSEAEVQEYNQPMKLKGETYIRNAPATAFVVLTYSDGEDKVPISLVGGTYYISGLKKQ